MRSADRPGVAAGDRVGRAAVSIISPVSRLVTFVPNSRIYLNRDMRQYYRLMRGCVPVECILLIPINQETNKE